MKLNFGKYSDKDAEYVILREPDYVAWMFGNAKSGRAKQIVGYINKSLLPTLDSKIPVYKCSGCGSTSTYATAYQNNPHNLYWWCEDCDPYSSGASPGKLREIRTYMDALHHAEACGGRKADFKSMVKSYSKGRGAPKTATKSSLDKFFG